MTQDTAPTVSGRHIAIASIHYWPEETGIAPYTTGLAEHLVEQGARVTVLTAMPFYPYWRVFEEYRGKLRMREERNGVTIHRMRHFVPTRQSAARRAAYEATFLPHALSGVRPDAVIGVIPSLSGGAIAATIARRRKVPYGIIVQDLSGQAAAQSGIAGGQKVAQLTTGAEARVLRGATRVVAVAEAFQPRLVEMGVAPDRIDIIRNWSHLPFPDGNRDETRARMGWASDQCVVLHAGNMGLKQALETVVEAARIAEHTHSHVRFVLMGDGNQRPMLQAAAEGLANIDFLPPKPKEELPSILNAADILLVNERNTVTDMSLPSKLTSYFVSGRPILAAVVSGGATRREIANSGAGLVVSPEDPNALLAGIKSLFADPFLSEQMGSKGSAYASSALSERASLSNLTKFVVGLRAQCHGPISAPNQMNSV